MFEQLLWSIRRWWWVVTCIAVAALIGAWLWADSRPAVYETEGSYLVQPRTSDPSDEVRAIEALTSSGGIATTYATIAESERTLAEVRTRLGLAEDEHTDLVGRARVVSGTNILKIGARGSDPVMVEAMAAAIGEVTVDFVSDLNDVFVISPLDEARLPLEPSSTNSGLVIGLAVVAGIVLGAVVAYGAERISPAAVPPPRWVRRIRDPHSTAYHKRYFRIRLDEEISRSGRGDHSFCVGVVHLVYPGFGSDQDSPAEFSDSELVDMVDRIRPTLRPHDILAFMGDGQFAAILPDMDVGDARSLVALWRDVVTAYLIDRPRRSTVGVSVGVCAYDGSAFVGDLEAERIATAS